MVTTQLGGHRLGSPLKLGHAVDGHRGVELCPLGVEQGLGRKFVAHQPEVLLLGGGHGHRGVHHQAGIDRVGQEPLGGGVHRGGPGEPGQQVPVRHRRQRTQHTERVDGAGHTDLGDQFKSRQATVVPGARHGKELVHGIQVGERGEHRAVVVLSGVEA